MAHGSHSQWNIIFQDIYETFPGQSYNFLEQAILDLKVINQDMYEKAYRIYSTYDRLLTFSWYSLSSSPLIAVSSTHFYLNFN